MFIKNKENLTSSRKAAKVIPMEGAPRQEPNFIWVRRFMQRSQRLLPQLALNIADSQLIKPGLSFSPIG